MNWIIEKEERTYSKKGYRFDFKTYHKKTLELLKNKKGSLLELGPGDGSFLERLKDNFNVCGVDIIKKNIELCRKKGIKVIKCDLNKKIPYPSNKFDVVIALEVLEHLFSYEKTINEAKRVLKQNGVFIVSVPNSCYWRYVLELILGRVPDALTGHEGHVAHFSLKQWKKLLEKYFKKVDVYSTEKMVSKLTFLPKNYFNRYCLFKCTK